MHDKLGRELKIGDAILVAGIVAALISELRPTQDACNIEAIVLEQDSLAVGSSTYNALKVTHASTGECVHTYLSHRNFNASDCELVGCADGGSLESRLPPPAPAIDPAAATEPLPSEQAGTAQSAASEGFDGNGSPTSETASAAVPQPEGTDSAV